MENDGKLLSDWLSAIVLGLARSEGPDVQQIQKAQQQGPRPPGFQGHFRTSKRLTQKYVSPLPRDGAGRVDGLSTGRVDGSMLPGIFYACFGPLKRRVTDRSTGALTFAVEVSTTFRH